ncbi:transcription termination factor MTERF5, chloroplastic-like protein [Tanacetum coccineum]
MESEGIEVDDYILSTVLSACGDIEWKGDEYLVKYSVKSNSWIIGCVALLYHACVLVVEATLTSGGGGDGDWRWLDNNVKYLRVLLGFDDTKVFKVVSKSWWLLASDFEKKISENILVLRKYELSSDKIESLLLKELGSLLQQGIEIVMLLSKATLDKKLRFFRSFRWTEEEIVRMTRSLPFCLRRSKGAIKASLEWFKVEIGYGGEYLSTHPKLLVYSLEKRVIPRYKVLASLKENNVLKNKLSLYTVVALSEEKFVTDFVLPYREVVPCLYESYTNAIAIYDCAAIEGSDPVTGLPRFGRVHLSQRLALLGSAVDGVISHDMNGCCSVMTTVLMISLVLLPCLNL